MQKARILLFLGIWIVVLPYLGFPHSWKDVLTAVSGVGLILLSYLLYRESKMKEGREVKSFDNFSENRFEDNFKDQGEAK